MLSSDAVRGPELEHNGTHAEFSGDKSSAATKTPSNGAKLEKPNGFVPRPPPGSPAPGRIQTQPSTPTQPNTPQVGPSPELLLLQSLEERMGQMEAKLEQVV